MTNSNNSSDIPIKNKKDEPDFELELEPPGIVVFKSDQINKHEIISEVILKNITNKIQCYKVKSTSNDFFRVRPPLGILKPNETQIIKFCFKSKFVPDCDFNIFVVYHISVEESEIAKSPAELWSKRKAEGVRRMKCQFEKLDGTTWPCTQKK